MFFTKTEIVSFDLQKGDKVSLAGFGIFKKWGQKGSQRRNKLFGTTSIDKDQGKQGYKIKAWEALENEVNK